MGVPATIDNDIPGTELSIGVDTALNTAVSVIDRIKDTATSHRKAMVVEVLGRDSGFLAAMSAIAGGADAVMVPEFETNPEDLLDLLNESYDKGKPRFTVVAAEGPFPSAEEFRDFVNEAGAPTRPTSQSSGTSSRARARAPSTAYSPAAWGPQRSRRSPTATPARWSG